MEIGVRLPHTGSIASPDLIREWCTIADQAGFGVLWGIDHIMMPEVIESKYTLARKPASIANNAVSNQMAPNFELMTSLTFAAAITTRIKLGSAVAVLTLRNAVLNARQLASLDRYSGGRVLYGVGVGWMKEEADAMNMPWDRRGARADEHIALLRAIWTAPGRHVEFHGEFYDFPPMDPEPRPAQPSIPILIGGHSEPAIDRAARLGDGWIAAGVSPSRLAELLPMLHERAAHHQRDITGMPIYCRGGQGPTTEEELRQFEELGVHAVQANVETLEDLKRFADEILPKFL